MQPKKDTLQIIPDYLISKDSTDEARRQWIIEHASHFVVVRRVNRRNKRGSVKKLADAEAWAEGIVKQNPGLRLMIYAVYGVSDVWVSTVSSNQDGELKWDRGHSRK